MGRRAPLLGGCLGNVCDGHARRPRRRQHHVRGVLDGARLEIGPGITCAPRHEHALGFLVPIEVNDVI